MKYDNCNRWIYKLLWPQSRQLPCSPVQRTYPVDRRYTTDSNITVNNKDERFGSSGISTRKSSWTPGISTRKSSWTPDICNRKSSWTPGICKDRGVNNITICIIFVVVRERVPEDTRREPIIFCGTGVSFLNRVEENYFESCKKYMFLNFFLLNVWYSYLYINLGTGSMTTRD